MHTNALSCELQSGLDNVVELVKTNQPSRLQESLKFLQKLPSDIHWLSSDDLHIIVTCTLEIFDHEGSALTWLKTKLKDQFGKCWICARTFHKLKAEVRAKRVVEYGFDDPSEDSLFTSLDGWDVERLCFSMNRANEMLKQNANISVKSLPSDLLSSLYECMLEPSILRTARLYELFKSVFLAVQQGGRFMRLSEDVVPGMITLLFSEDQRLRQWAEKSFSKLSRVILFQDFNTILQVELHRNLRMYLLEPESREVISRILYGLPHILKVVDLKIVTEFLCSSDCDMARLIAAQAMNVENGPLIALRSLAELLKKLGTGYWGRVSPIIPISTMEGIMGSRKVQELFEHPDLIGKLEIACDESDLTEWILPFIRSTDRVSRQRVSGLLLLMLLERFQLPRFPPKARREYAYYGLETLKLLLEDASINFTDPSESNNILQKDTRDIALKYVKPVFDMACPFFPPDNPMDAKLQVVAHQVVCFAVSIDCSRLQNDFLAFTKDKTPPIIKLSTMYTDMYMHAMGSITVNDSEFPLQVLRSVRPSAFVDSLENINTDTDIRDFNQCVEEVRKATRSILQRVEEFDDSSAKALFKSRDACITVASLLFSPDNGIYQANLDLVKQGFEATGKTEALRGMLQQSFEATIEGLASAMSTICSLGLFSPVPRLVRTCVSVIEIICSPANGIIIGVQLDNTSRLVLQKLWKETWRMLEILFRTTPSWSTKIARDLITEFMRDALELADNLFIVLQPLARAIGGFDDSSSDLASTTSMMGLERTLLQSCSSAVKPISSWLRLNDDSLLIWCLNLLTSIIHRFAQAKLQLDDSAISYLEGIAHHRKGFKNKLDEEACAKIILALSELTGGVANNETSSGTSKLMGISQSKTLSKSQLERLDISKSETNSDNDSDNGQRLTRENSETSSISSRYNDKSRTIMSALPLKSSMITHSSKSTGKTTALDRLKANIRLENQERKALGGSPKIGTNGMLKTKHSDLRAVRRAPVQPSKYTSKRQDSSSSSASSDSDTEGLFSEPKAHRSPRIRKVEKKTIQSLQSAVVTEEMQSVKRQMQREKALRNARARVTPDLSPLYRKILQWNFDHDGDMPPNIDSEQLQGVSNTYPEAAKYYKTFEPLLLCEGWEQVRQAVEQQAYSRSKCTVVSRAAVDDFVDVYAQVSYKTVSNNNLATPDLLVLYCGSKDGQLGQKCFGKVQSLAKKKDLVELTIRCLPSARLLETLRPKAEIDILKLFKYSHL